MALAFGAAGTVVYSTGNPAPAYPTGGTASRRYGYVLTVATKPDNTPADQAALEAAGWTFRGAFAGGAGSQGIDTGPMRVAKYTRESATVLTGTQTVTVTGNNVTAAWIDRWEIAATGEAYDWAITGGADTSTGTAYSAVTSSVAAGFIQTGDMLDVATIFPTDTLPTWGTPTLTAQGAGSGTIALGTVTQRQAPTTTSGQDMGGRQVTCAPTVTGSVTAGTLTFAATLSGTTTNAAGPTVVLRIRAVTAPTAPSAPTAATGATAETVDITLPALQGGATSYNLYRAGTFVVSGLAGGAVYTDSGTVAAASAVPSSITYYVRGVNGAGTSPVGSNSNAVTADPAPPAFSLASGDNKITVNITGRPYAASYKVYRGLAGGSRTLVHTSASQSASASYSWDDTSVSNGVAYDYHVVTSVATPTARDSAASAVQSKTPAPPVRVALIHDDPTPTTSDLDVQTYLTNAGMVVTLVVESPTVAVNPASYDVVVISESGSATAVDPYVDWAGGVVCLETAWNTLGLATGAASADPQGTLATWLLNTDASVLGAYATGINTVVYGGAGATTYGATLGTQAPGSVPQASNEGSGFIYALTLEVGATRANSLGPAPDRRVGIGLISTRPSSLNATGQGVLAALVDWAARGVTATVVQGSVALTTQATLAAAPTAKVEALVDDASTLTKWNYTAGDLFATDGAAITVTKNGTNSGAQGISKYPETDARWSLLDSFFVVEIDTAAITGTSWRIGLASSESTTTTVWGFTLSGSGWQATNESSGQSFTPVANMRYLALRSVGSMLHWFQSADGITWTLIRSATALLGFGRTSLADAARFVLRDGTGTNNAGETFRLLGVNTGYTTPPPVIYEGTAALAATSALTADGTVSTGPATYQGTAALSAASVLTGSAVRTRDAAVTLAATATLTTTGVRTVAATTVTLTATATLTAAAIRTRDALATLAAQQVTSADGTRAPPGAATLTATSTLATSGVRDTAASVAFTATAALTATGTVIVVQTATVALSAAAALTSSAVRDRPATAALTAQAVLVAPAFVEYAGTVTLTATHVLAAATGRETFGAATLAATSVLGASGVRTRDATATLTAAHVLAASAERYTPASVTLSATAALSTDGTRVAVVATALAASAVLAVTAIRTRPATAALSAAATLAASAARETYAAATLAAASALSADGVRATDGAVTLSAAAALDVTEDRETYAALALVEAATLATDGTPVRPVGAALVAVAALAASAVRVVLAAVPLTAASTLTTSGIRTRPTSAALAATSTLTTGYTRTTFATAALSAAHATGVAGVRETYAVASLATLATLSTTAARTVHAAADLETDAALYGDSFVQGKVVAAVDLATDTVLAADADRTGFETVTLTTASILATSVLRTSPATATLTAAHTLAATGVRTRPASATLAAVAALATAGTRTAGGVTTLTETATLAAAAVTTRHGTVTLAAAAVLATAADYESVEGVALTTEAALDVAAVRTRPGMVALAADTSLTVAATPVRPVAATLTAVHTLVASGVRTGVVTLALTAAATLSTDGERLAAGTSASLTASAALAVSVLRQTGVAATLQAAAALVVQAARVQPAATTLTTATVLTAGAVRRVAATLALAEDAALDVTAQRTRPAATALAARADLDTASSAARDAAVALVAHAVLAAATAVPTRIGAATLTATHVLAVLAVRTRPGIVRLFEDTELVVMDADVARPDLVTMEERAILAGASLFEDFVGWGIPL